MFGRAKGKDLAQALLDTISEKGYEIPLNQLLFLRSDGPNVNKTVHKYTNDHMKEIGLHGLVKFHPCPLHIVHNGFRKGLTVFGERAEELALDLFQWFRTHTCQKEDRQHVRKVEPGGRCVFTPCSVPLANTFTVSGEDKA